MLVVIVDVLLAAVGLVGVERLADVEVLADNEVLVVAKVFSDVEVVNGAEVFVATEVVVDDRLVCTTDEFTETEELLDVADRVVVRLEARILEVDIAAEVGERLVGGLEVVKFCRVELVGLVGTDAEAEDEITVGSIVLVVMFVLKLALRLALVLAMVLVLFLTSVLMLAFVLVLALNTILDVIGTEVEVIGAALVVEDVVVVCVGGQTEMEEPTWYRFKRLGPPHI